MTHFQILQDMIIAHIIENGELVDCCPCWEYRELDGITWAIFTGNDKREPFCYVAE
jgi:hypothetical protein